MTLRPALRLLVAVTSTLFALPALAAWTLDASRAELSFVTIKSGDIAEVHRFGTLSGQIGDDGAAEISIALASVDTHIPVRDERMQGMLFETAIFPQATLRATLPAAALDPPTAHSADFNLEGTLDLHGVSAPVKFTVTATRLGAARVLVTSRRPLLIDAAQFGLAAGVEKLREIAKLPAISKAVPVSFVLEFTRAP